MNKSVKMASLLTSVVLFQNSAHKDFLWKIAGFVSWVESALDELSNHVFTFAKPRL